MRLGRSRTKVEPVLQGAYAECGLACVAMILRAANIDVTLQQINARWQCGTRALKLSSLVDILAAYGVMARALRVSLDDLSRVQLPCIIHWNFDHYVVLEKVDARDIHIIDPSIGRRRVPMDQASQLFTGVVLQPDFDQLPPPVPREEQKAALALLCPDWPRLIAKSAPVVALTLAVNVLLLLVPAFQKLMFDYIDESQAWSRLTTLGLLFASIALGHWLMQLGRVHWLSTYRAMLMRTLSASLFRNLVFTKTRFFETRSPSRVANQYQAVQTISTAASEQLVGNGVDALFVLLGVVLVLILVPWVGAVLLGGICVFFLIQWVTTRELVSRMATSLQADMVEGAFVFETIESMAAIRVYNAELPRLAMWTNVHNEKVDAQSSYWSLLQRVRASQEFATTLTWLATLYVGLSLYLSEALTLGTVAAAGSWASFVLARARSVSESVSSMLLLKTHLARIEDVVRAPKIQPASLLATVSSPSREPTPRIGLADVWFRYDDFSPYVLKGCSLQVTPGSWIGIRGQSGAGKSTLGKVLLGLLEPSSGRVDQPSPAREISAGVVSQNDVLLSGSVLDNICFFDVDPDVERAERCARICCAHDFIETLPMKYGAIIGRKGVGLSAGQAQRILLARALYKYRGLLVLDEFTSNFDDELEERVLTNMRSEGLTIVMIAHRARAIAACSTVYDMVDGRLECISQCDFAA